MTSPRSTPPNAGPFLAWPSWKHLRFAWLVSLAVTLGFALVYGGTDWITAQRDLRFRVHLEAELAIPFRPAFTLAYLSITPLLLAVPFVLRTRREISDLALRHSLAIAAAGVVFLLFPAKLGYPPPDSTGFWNGLFAFADRLNLDHNLVPSLHVALSVICLEALATRTSVVGRWLLRAWGGLIAVSTLFTHQHHLLDVATGYALAVGIMKLPLRRGS